MPRSRTRDSKTRPRPKRRENGDVYEVCMSGCCPPVVHRNVPRPKG